MIELLKIVALLLFVSGLGVLAVWLQYRMEQQEIGLENPESLMIVFVPEDKES